jgi:hypothetical protein
MLSAAKVIADEVVAIVRAVLDSPAGINVKVNKNTLGKDKSRLYDDVVANLLSSEDIVVSLLVNDYIKFIESGRRAGAKMPPFQPIYEWCKRKGLPSDNSTVWAICKAISRDGIAPRPIMSNVLSIIDNRWDSEWSDSIFEEITKELDKIFQ